MDAIMAYLEGINWENIGTLVTDFIAKMDIPGFFEQVVNFFKDLFTVIAG